MPSKRVDVRIEFKRLGELGPRLVEIAAEAKRPCKIEMDKPRPRICGTRLPEEIDCLIHMAEKKMAMSKIEKRNA